MGGRTRNYLNVNAPEHWALREDMKKMGRFFTDAVSLQRGCDAIAPVTWDRAQLHHLRECTATFYQCNPHPHSHTHTLCLRLHGHWISQS